MSENKFNELKKVNGEVDFVCLNTQVYHGGEEGVRTIIFPHVKE